jgi:hypothetical protein
MERIGPRARPRAKPMGPPYLLVHVGAARVDSRRSGVAPRPQAHPLPAAALILYYNTGYSLTGDLI